MKLLVFAHTPPPHHGQSYMVKLMLDGFGGDRWLAERGTTVAGGERHGIECYHVNARLSRHLEDLGSVRPGKIGLLLWYCLQAIWCRFRHDVTTFYYVPAPGKTSALVRDWLVFALCRPFFKRVVLHWHAAGMAKWLETCGNNFSRTLTYRLMGQADLCIVLSNYNYSDAEKLWPRRTCIVGNGIPDPCPDFETKLLPRRLARHAVRTKLLDRAQPSAEEFTQAGADAATCRILYLAHATESKGLFDCIAGVRLAAELLRRDNSAVQLHLTVAGDFITPEERSTFEALLQHADLNHLLTYAGFVSGERKDAALRDADIFCFPTFYQNENQPVNVIEAMAWGLPLVTTRWRSVPEILPPDYDGLVEPHAPDQIANAILRVMRTRSGAKVRERFVEHYRIDRHLDALAAALRAVEPPSVRADLSQSAFVKPAQASTSRR